MLRNKSVKVTRKTVNLRSMLGQCADEGDFCSFFFPCQDDANCTCFAFCTCPFFIQISNANVTVKQRNGQTFLNLSPSQTIQTTTINMPSRRVMNLKVTKVPRLKNKNKKRAFAQFLENGVLVNRKVVFNNKGKVIKIGNKRVKL
ncbi:hypothetical protein [Longirhabdus pacifica]|uniref:hypothetical protein n=1 Tax=Longirhabdus pacifica TaxID=2305227 RepID=UPI001008DBAD|nr:hypothetical protein [Longirhabdus pacifica]